jgi:hypothetical protein
MRGYILAAMLFAGTVAICAARAQVAGPSAADSENAVARVFESIAKQNWRPMKRLIRPNLQYLCESDKFTDPNKAEWGMGLEDFERISYADETQLTAKLHDLLVDWKAGRTRKRSFFYDSNVHRFAVKECGTADRATTIVVAVYLSGWDAWNRSVALMLGK